MISLLSLIPMVLKYWKIGLIGIAALFIAGFCIHLDRAGYQRRVNEDKAAQIETLQKRILTLSMITEKDNQRAVADAFLNTKLKDLASATPRNDGPCLDAAAAHRVWTVRQLASGSTPVPSRRVPNVLPWRRNGP